MDVHTETRGQFEEKIYEMNGDPEELMNDILKLPVEKVNILSKTQLIFKL